MSRFPVSLPSVGSALRAGSWTKLGVYPMAAELLQLPVMVQWPVGTLEVILWQDGRVVGTTQVHDPAIQEFEIIAAYDAEHHVPLRLQRDFEMPADAWKSGGSIRRQRLMKEDMAARFPDQPFHQLPDGWVPVG